MQFDQAILEEISKRPSRAWSGVVFRHTFADYPPDRENTTGARWNPPGVPAIYTSLLRETVVAEAEYQISAQPLRPKAKRTIHQIELKLSSVFSLTDPRILAACGVSMAALSEIDMGASQEVGGAAEHSRHDGLLVPSVRHDGVNLVIFPRRTTADYLFKVVSSDVIQERLF